VSDLSRPAENTTDIPRTFTGPIDGHRTQHRTFTGLSGGRYHLVNATLDDII
jgi:hypothetical protein